MMGAFIDYFSKSVIIHLTKWDMFSNIRIGTKLTTGIATGYSLNHYIIGESHNYITGGESYLLCNVYPDYA